jgi:hypothetical protein
MRPEERDISYLWDMRQAAGEISEFMLGVPYNLGSLGFCVGGPYMGVV